MWIRADSREVLVSDFTTCANLLNLPGKDSQDQNLVVTAVKHWLEDNTGWLLIFDNADDPTLIEDFLPLNHHGHILLTSRAQVFDSLGISNPIELDKLPPHDAQEFLRKRTRREQLTTDEQAAVTQIAHKLDYLPLALEQAGAYIAKTQAQFKNYLVSYETRGLKLLEQAKFITGKYPQSVATTWLLNFEQVEQASAAAADLLRASAFLHPEAIPLELITRGAPELGLTFSAALANVDSDPLVLDETLEPLTRYSLIRRNREAQTYDIHRLVQEVIKDRMDEAAQRLWAERVVRAVNMAFPRVEVSSWPQCERLLPHAQACATLIGTWHLKLDASAHLLNQAGFYLQERAQYALALSLTQQVLAIDRNVFGEHHLNTATTLNNLAELYRSLGDHTQALPLHEQALAIRRAALGERHPDVTISLNNLASLYKSMGNYAQALPLFQQALTISREILGKRHPITAITLNNLAELYQSMGDYAQALPLFQQALTIRQEVLGEYHPATAITLNNLAEQHRSLGDCTQASLLYEQALAIWQQIAPNHPNTATILENYALLLRATNREAKAEKLEARAKAIREEHVQENRKK